MSKALSAQKAGRGKQAQGGWAPGVPSMDRWMDRSEERAAAGKRQRVTPTAPRGGRGVPRGKHRARLPSTSSDSSSSSSSGDEDVKFVDQDGSDLPGEELRADEERSEESSEGGTSSESGEVEEEEDSAAPSSISKGGAKKAAAAPITPVKEGLAAPRVFTAPGMSPSPNSRATTSGSSYSTSTSRVFGTTTMDVSALVTGKSGNMVFGITFEEGTQASVAGMFHAVTGNMAYDAGVVVRMRVENLDNAEARMYHVVKHKLVDHKDAMLDGLQLSTCPPSMFVAPGPGQKSPMYFAMVYVKSCVTTMMPGTTTARYKLFEVVVKGPTGLRLINIYAWDNLASIEIPLKEVLIMDGLVCKEYNGRVNLHMTKAVRTMTALNTRQVRGFAKECAEFIKAEEEDW